MTYMLVIFFLLFTTKMEIMESKKIICISEKSIVFKNLFVSNVGSLQDAARK